MYVPHFNAMDDAEVGPFLAAHPAGHLVTVGPDGRPDVTLLPLVIDEGRVLAHFARANEHWRRIEAHRPDPWAVTDAPERYVSGQLRAIVGVEIHVDQVSAKAKLSQNRSEADRTGAIAGLLEEPGHGAHEVAEAMRAALGD